MNSTAPIVQKKLIAAIARNTRGCRVVIRTSVIEERITLKSSGTGFICEGAGGTNCAVRKPRPAVRMQITAAHSTGIQPAKIVPARIAI